MLPNVSAYPFLITGASLAGVPVTSVNPAYTSSEVARQLKAANAKAVVATTQSEPLIREALQKLGRKYAQYHVESGGTPIYARGMCNCIRTPENLIQFRRPLYIHFATDFAQTVPFFAFTAEFSSSKIILVDGSTDSSKDSVSYESLLCSSKESSVKDLILEARRTLDFESDVVWIPFSSGTTGVPKGVELTHQNLIANGSQSIYAEGFDFQPQPTGESSSCNP